MKIGNIVKFLGENKNGIIKKTLIGAGSIIGLALAAGLSSSGGETEGEMDILLDSDGDEIETFEDLDKVETAED